MFIRNFVVVLSLVSVSWSVQAQVGDPPSLRWRLTDAYELPKDPDRPRSYFWAPLGSVFLPGLDQWVEGRLGYGAAYSGTAFLGLQLASQPPRLVSEDARLYGAQIYQAAGFMSAYHSFRMAAKSHGDSFAFLGDESPGDLMLAPFNLSYLAEPTTFIPLAVVLAWVGTHVYRYDQSYRTPTLGQSYLTAGISYNAGVSEEAAFRGWLMPMMRHQMGSDFWSNLTTATLFSAAHYTGDFIPWPQFLVGFYLGWLTQHNDWTLSEAIFVHAWWDVIAIGGDYMFSSVMGRPKPKEFNLKLPLLVMQF